MKALIHTLLTLSLALIGANGCAESPVYRTDPLVDHIVPAANSTEQTAFSRAQLDQMLAPIALYPDTVLSHILIAATYPLEVVQADRWVQANSQLGTADAVQAAALEDWDPSVVALVAFPDILRRMSENLNWTQDLGEAFLADEQMVLDEVQLLREKAYAAGSLQDMKYAQIEKQEKTIIIEPATQQIIYVPYYDTRYVYGSWWWPDYPPVYWHTPVNYVHVGHFHWGPRIFVDTHFFFSTPRWRERRVVVIDRHVRRQMPHFNSAKKIAAYRGATHWQHEPKHRRNIRYRNEKVSNVYGRDGDNRHEYRRRDLSDHLPNSSPASRKKIVADRDSSPSTHRRAPIEGSDRHNPKNRASQNTIENKWPQREKLPRAAEKEVHRPATKEFVRDHDRRAQDLKERLSSRESKAEGITRVERDDNSRNKHSYRRDDKAATEDRRISSHTQEADSEPQLSDDKYSDKKSRYRVLNQDNKFDQKDSSTRTTHLKRENAPKRQERSERIRSDSDLNRDRHHERK